MLTSLALIFLAGMLLGAVFTRLKLPSLLGMLITGMLLGPCAFNVIDRSLLDISADLRQLALVIILTRAGLSLDINDLKKVGRPAILMCFVPACFEILAMTYFAPRFFPVTTLEAAFLLVALEKVLEHQVPFSGLLAVMSAGAATLRFAPVPAKRLSAKFSKLWIAAEILLFVLVGATVDVRFAAAAGGKAVALLLIILVFRMVAVLLCLLRTRLNTRERLFCMIAYVPKATVQAAIGGIPLAMGLGCGSIVLTVAVLSILITAPLGALGIDITYRQWLAPRDGVQAHNT